MDLTNYIDHNAAANDETSQFISDALVNNPMLGLTENGIGFVSVFDPKNGFNFKFGFQQSNSNATSLNESIFTMGESWVSSRGSQDLAKEIIDSGIAPTMRPQRDTAMATGLVSIRGFHPESRCSAGMVRLRPM
jgi:hypothetical protein